MKLFNKTQERASTRSVHPRSAQKRRGLYLPALTIVMVAATLIVMHAVSTIRTLDRERRHWEDLVEKNAHDIISMIKGDMMEQHVDTESSPEQLRGLLNRVVENLDIAYAGFLGANGEWITGVRVSRAPPFSLPVELDMSGRGIVRKYRRIQELPGGRSVFEYGELLPVRRVRAAVVGLWMTPLEEAREEDIRHAFMMGGILLVLGSAAFYFIFVVQNYYLVERTLAEMRTYTENVVESMANGLITVDTEGRIVSTNKMASQILGIDRKQIRGRLLDEVTLLPGIDFDDVLRHERNIIEEEVDCPSKRGVVPLSVSVTPLRGPEDVRMGAVIILRDMREIRELQEKVRRSERLASLGRLASGVAHEIRNPLSSIKGFTQYFRDKFGEASEDRSYATIMIQEVDRLNRVITQLLDFARPREIQPQPVPITRILKHAIALIQPDLDKKGIDLVAADLPEGEIYVDSDQITQAFLNILLNAIESMEHGGELRVHVTSSPETGLCDITISDTGPGLSREDVSKIFDPFFSTKKKGTGLGLAITASIIEAHGGEISVESRKGKGTAFRILLPLARRDGLEGRE